MTLDSLKGRLHLADRLARIFQKLLKSGLPFDGNLLSLADQTGLDENDCRHVSEFKRQVLQAGTASNVLFHVLISKTSFNCNKSILK